MAGPGKQGDISDTPEDQIALAKEHEQVVALVLGGLSYKKASEVTGYSPRHIGRIMLAERARQLDDKPLAEHRATIWAYLVELLEALRPAITGEPVPVGAIVPDKKDVASVLATLDRMTRLVGADAPRRSEVVTALEVTQNDEAFEYAKRVATRARLSKVVTVEPTPVTESANGAPVEEERSKVETEHEKGDVA
jgi:hypothetical protein